MKTYHENNTSFDRSRAFDRADPRRFGAKETTPLAVPEGAHAGDLTGLKDCEYQPSGSKAKYAAECGTLVVPENWEVADSRLIALPVVRIPASEMVIETPALQRLEANRIIEIAEKK